MTHDDKVEIKELTLHQLQLKKTSANRYATEAGISPATLSSILNDDWEKISSKMWMKLARASGFLFGKWNTALTDNLGMLHFQLEVAQEDSMSVAVSGRAGYGKSHTYKKYANENSEAYYLECDDHMTRSIFINYFLQKLGVPDNGLTLSQKAELVIRTLKNEDTPLVIMDEFDKLNESTWMFFITLYNKLDGHCGFFLSGSPYFEERVKRGLRRNKKGYHEIYSRIGRRFITLYDTKYSDVTDVCQANGIKDTPTINEIWNDCNGDLRRVKRLILIHIKKRNQ